MGPTHGQVDARDPGRGVPGCGGCAQGLADTGKMVRPGSLRGEQETGLGALRLCPRVLLAHRRLRGPVQDDRRLQPEGRERNLFCRSGDRREVADGCKHGGNIREGPQRAEPGAVAGIAASSTTLSITANSSPAANVSGALSAASAALLSAACAALCPPLEIAGQGP